jgi:hypothetical protein
MTGKKKTGLFFGNEVEKEWMPSPAKTGVRGGA